MKILKKSISDIIPYSKNAKKHDKKQIKQVAESIKRFGFVQPIVIDKDNVVVIGHCRLEAAKFLEIKEVPCLLVDNLTQEEINALRLADNKLNESDWDMSLVIEELKELDLELLELTGFDSDLILEPDENDDKVPDVPEEPKSKLGEIYQLGEHRVMCGDSTSIDAVEKLMNGKKADMSFTSPPYNVGHNVGYKDSESKYKSSDDNLEDYRELIANTTNISLDCAKDVFVNLQILANNKKDILLWLAELVDVFKDIFFWKKQTVQPAMTSNVANSQTELILLFGSKNNSRSWGNQKFRGTFSNLIETKSASGENKNSKIHNATFPVELPMKFIVEAYKEGSIILDLFVGTGTTIIAAEKTGRICYGMELDPRYVDVIIQRWEEYTGNKAKKLN